MKKLIIFFILSLSISVNAQYESVFGDQSTSWKLLMSSVEFIELDFVSRTHTSDVAFDTIIGGETYKRYQYTDESGLFQYEMKEDTVEGKVWMGMLDFDDTMYLKYDLSLNVGDTFYFHNPIDTGIVQNVFYQGGKKHIEFNKNHYLSGEPIMFIEGVGPTIGFVDWILYSPSIEQIGYIVCQQKDGLTTYVNEISNSCTLSFANTDEIDNELSLELYPNPISSNYFNIITKSKLTRKDIQIYNLNGSDLIDFKLEIIKDNKYEISLPEVQTGVYTIQINTIKGVLRKKLVVLN